VVADGVDVDRSAAMVAWVVEVGTGWDVEVDAPAEGVADDPDRVAVQTPAATPSATAMITTRGAGRFHQGRFRRCLPRMATTLAERSGRPADGWPAGPGYTLSPAPMLVHARAARQSRDRNNDTSRYLSPARCSGIAFGKEDLRLDCEDDARAAFRS
jgi:hypothetical protein